MSDHIVAQRAKQADVTELGWVEAVRWGIAHGSALRPLLSPIACASNTTCVWQRNVSGNIAARGSALPLECRENSLISRAKRRASTRVTPRSAQRVLLNTTRGRAGPA